MKNKIKISVAVDLSYSPGKMALAMKSEGELDLIEFSREDVKNGANLLDWISSSLSEKAVNISEVDDWTIGTGPGAFSQLRMLSATILGIKFSDLSIRARGLPSGSVFSSLFSESNADFSVLYHMMKNIFVLNSFRKNGDECVLLKTSSASSISELRDDILKSSTTFALVKNGETLELGDLGAKIRLLKDYPVKELIFLNPIFWDSASISDLIYARPAAVIPPGSLSKT
ncbi:MAG TPA: hypothetical protein PK821_05345 [Victivallales bacterium]|nr:hypothetical protein [Victivallales bacterium]